MSIRRGFSHEYEPRRQPPTRSPKSKSQENKRKRSGVRPRPVLSGNTLNCSGSEIGFPRKNPGGLPSEIHSERVATPLYVAAMAIAMLGWILALYQGVEWALSTWRSASVLDRLARALAA